MKLFLAALAIWSLPFFGVSCGSANVQNPPTPERELTPVPIVKATITLTKEHPTRSFAVYPSLTDPPTVVEISVTKVVNPAARAVNIFVHLAPVNEKAGAVPPKFAVGNFSLYPADRPGKFMLDPASAFRKISETKDVSKVKEWLVVFELEQKAEQGSSPVEVTIEAPQWKRDKD